MSWDRVPSKRPSFEQIASEIERLRAVRSAQNINLQTLETQELMASADRLSS